ncbi:MAG: hypothetical protein JXR48_04355, partial [Candidatus Delongbacteria bacterium]|nr:hypothetical protein [Candidatus Delongbacteria bacterium]
FFKTPIFIDREYSICPSNLRRHLYWHIVNPANPLTDIRYRPEHATGSATETITQYSATRGNIIAAVNDLMYTKNITDDDFLYVWVMSHGGTPMQSSIGLIGVGGTYDEMLDFEFANIFRNIPANKEIYQFSLNHAQGFNWALVDFNIFKSTSSGFSKSYRADDLANDATSIIENEVINGRTYYHGEFNFHNYISAVGKTPSGSDTYNSIPISNADSDRIDGVISIDESYVWAYSQNSTLDSPSNEGFIHYFTSLEYPTLIYADYALFFMLQKGIMAIPLDLETEAIDLMLPTNSNTTLFEERTVTVKPNYDFIINDGASLEILDQSEINVEVGGVFSLETGSKLVVNGEARLTGDIGKSNATIIVKDDSKLTLSANSYIQAMQNSSILLGNNSELIIETDANLIMAEGTSIIVDGNARITGDIGQTSTTMVLMDNSKLTITAGSNMSISAGTSLLNSLQMNDNSEIIIEENAALLFNEFISIEIGENAKITVGDYAEFELDGAWTPYNQKGEVIAPNI